ncbi:MAG: hypothetical protein EXR71_01370 [Myxococcales bacterium]|nr:hypothetical protein [Myxococcales bacterium]
MAGGGGGTEELNLVPYLDIMVNLIMFMVTVTAYLVQLKEAPILAPTYGRESNGSGEQKPFLTVAISSTQIKVIGGGAIQGSEQSLKPDDFRGLTTQLRSLKSTIPNMAENLVVTADKEVVYSKVVKVMDAARDDATGPLFPNITLSVVLP